MVVATAQKSNSPDQPRHVTVLGSTGSVGRNTVELIARDPDAYVVEALTAGRNVAHLAEQARALRPKLAVVAPGGLPPRLAIIASKVGSSNALIESALTAIQVARSTTRASGASSGVCIRAV